MSWSAYYEQLYEKVQASNANNKGALMQRLNTMIATAKSYERNEISAEQFAHARRQMQAEQQAENDMSEAQRRQSLAAALQKSGEAQAQRNAEWFKAAQPKPVTNTRCTSFGNQLDCTTR